MEQEYTGFNDVKNNQLYFNSIVRSRIGLFYVIKRDERLGYVIIDMFSGTIEKLTPETARDLYCLSN